VNSRTLASVAVLLIAGGCERAATDADTAAAPAASASVTVPATAPAPAPVAWTPVLVDTAAYTPDVATAQDRTPAVLRAQVLLDRARFSPGVIDGKPGENVRQAIAAFEEANALPVDGQLDEAVFQKLTQIDSRPVLTQYVITAEDVAGPFIDSVPKDIEDQAKLKKLSYTSAAELIAEKFHMTEDLLKTLNPNVDLTKAGATITVPDQGTDTLPGTVATIEVDKAEKAVKAFDAQGKLLAFYPATIGSDELATPDGTLKVRAVSRNPTYTWDPTKMRKEGPKEKLTVAAGPNNPVGIVWIALDKPTYGIHGAPDPQLIGKRSSSGCVRLTNWDAIELANAVKAGVVVKFVGGNVSAAV
jgi:lipoprotein-anchoring transpeptidase ErfK/SrfK